MIEAIDQDTNAQHEPIHDHGGLFKRDEEIGFHGMNNEDYSIDALRNRNEQFILKTKETNLLTQTCGQYC